MNREILNTINELLFEKKSNLEKEILEYLKHNYTNIPNISLVTIADECYCSATSITRVIKKLGFNSYKDLQTQIQNYTNYNETSFNERYNKFVEIIQNENCIYIYGKGGSHLAALYLFRTLLKYGIDASFIYDEDLLYSLENKTLVLISNSGQTSSINTFAKELKSYNNCKILSLTKKNSELYNNSDFTLFHTENIQHNRDNPCIMFNLINDIICILSKNSI